MTIPKQIIAHIRKRKLSLPAVAEAAGYERTMLYRWDKGEAPSLFAVENVCEVLHLRLALVPHSIQDLCYAPAHLKRKRGRQEK